MHIQKILVTLLLQLAFYQVTIAGVIILNGLTHIHDTQQGAIVEGEIKLHNLSEDQTERVSFYLQDLSQDCEGNLEYLEVGQHPRSFGDWISFNSNEKILQPGEKYNLKYSIRVPQEIADSMSRGSYWGVVMIEIAKPINEDFQYGVQINSKIRYGVQVIANVGQRIDPELNFHSLTIEKNKQLNYVLDVNLENKGDYIVQPTLILELFNDLGNSVKKAEAKFKKVYPSSCKDFSIEIADVPAGAYDGILIADYGGEIYGLNVSVNIQED